MGGFEIRHTSPEKMIQIVCHQGTSTTGSYNNCHSAMNLLSYFNCVFYQRNDLRHMIWTYWHMWYCNTQNLCIYFDVVILIMSRCKIWELNIKFISKRRKKNKQTSKWITDPFIIQLLGAEKKNMWPKGYQ